MRSFLLGLVLVAIPALGDGGAVSIRLYTHFQQAPPDAVMDSIQDEMARIMSTIGLAFKWSSLTENKGNELSARLAVIHFTGHCDVVNLATLNSRSGALGWTYMTDGAILPFSDIDCDGIRAFLQADLLAKPKEGHEDAFGRAVGRVLAHELYHIFANTSRHSSHGVAKPYYSAQELLSKSFKFEPKECEELRRYWSDLVTGAFRKPVTTGVPPETSSDSGN
jgi:hypothetical protein